MKDLIATFAALHAETARVRSPLTGVVNWTPGAEIEDLADVLPDGVHRLDGSDWQFTVADGALVRAVRSDMTGYVEPETVHPIPDGEAKPDDPPPIDP